VQPASAAAIARLLQAVVRSIERRVDVVMGFSSLIWIWTVE
jgi:hypothetical protein